MRYSLHGLDDCTFICCVKMPALQALEHPCTIAMWAGMRTEFWHANFKGSLVYAQTYRIGWCPCPQLPAGGSHHYAIDLTVLAMGVGAPEKCFACVTLRPGIEVFLQEMRRHYELAVWTAAGQRCVRVHHSAAGCCLMMQLVVDVRVLR